MFFPFCKSVVMELRYVKGLSDKRIEDLNKMGIFTAEQLIRHFPRSYLDLRRSISLREAVHNDFALIKARIIGKPNVVKTRSRFSVVKAIGEQDGEIFSIVWFNQPYVTAKIVSGEEYLLYGRIRNRFGQISITNPSFELLDKNTNLKGIVPVYSVKNSLSQKVMRSVIADALKKVDVVSAIPEQILKIHQLSPLKDAYYSVHNPGTMQEKDESAERVALEEYFILITAFRIIKGDKEQIRINRYGVGGKDLNNFTQRFGFEFTDGQKKAVNDIFSDMNGPKIMNRLIQGDVGSGKTAVSLTAIYIAAKSGFQSVMLSPTEVLARQSFEIISRIMPEFKVGFLSGSTKAKEKNLIKQQIATGEIDVLCGTHAVLEGDVVFKNLSLCVCDEQQRFGVSQRSGLVGKGKACDVLVLSATPIPRTLSLIFYGDLDISTIIDKPKDRVEIKTNVVPGKKYDDMLNFIQREVDSGRQVFFVCPKIEGDEEGSVISVKEIYEELQRKLPRLNCAILHGKMKDSEKTQIMLDFKERKFDALVSTTVIEVGIDVPNATIMVIFGADRFGLSQLHQLRGRVGRGSFQSYCFLLSDSENEKAVNRLNVLKNNTDGFKISEADFEERGSGDFMGMRQCGKTGGFLGALSCSASTIFLAKRLSEEALNREGFNRELRELAINRYNSLKDVTLN